MIQEKIHGIGIDIIEIARIKRLSLRWGDRFEQKVLYIPGTTLLWSYIIPL